MKHAALLLSRGDPAWAQLREAIHICDNWLKRVPSVANNYTLVRAFGSTIRKKGYERLAGRVDTVLKESILEEQGSREGAEEPKATLAPNLSSPSWVQKELFDDERPSEGHDPAPELEPARTAR